MATIYVDSAATGGADGTSWTDAYTTLLAAVDDVGLVSADEIWVEKDHAETPGSTQTYIMPTDDDSTSVRILAIDSVDDSLFTPDWSTDTAPSIIPNAAASIVFQGSFFMWGIRVDNTTGSANIDFNSSHDMEVHHSLFEMDAATDFIQMGTTGGAAYRFYNCIFDLHSSTGLRLVEMLGGHFKFFNCEFIGANRTYGHNYDINPKDVLVAGCDLSQMHPNLTRVAFGSSGVMKYQDCLLPTSSEYTDVDPFTTGVGKRWLEMTWSRCHIGTLTDPPFVTCRLDFVGATGAISNLTTYAVDAAAMTATYRLGGLTDGVRNTPLCWPMMAHGNESQKGWRSTVSPPIYVWIEGDGTAKTLTVRFASGGGGDGTGGRWQDDQLWMEIISGNDAASNSLGVLTTTRPDPKATAADLADDTSAWVGASVGTKQKLTASVSPDLEGPATVWLHFAPGDATDQTIFIDPIVEVT